MTAAPRKGLTANIFRAINGGDYSLDGVSNRYPGVVIVGVRGQSFQMTPGVALATGRGLDELPRVFTANERYAEVELVVRELGGGLYVHAEPVEGEGRWAMMGGCYIETSDSRFGDMLRAIYGDDRYQVGPIPLHDRYES